MSVNSITQKTQKKILVDADKYGTIDTSLLYEELRRNFDKSKTDLEIDFRKLVDWVKAGDQQTHQIHPYPAKLLPHIAHMFVNASILSKPNSIVLDPFCGSGTVALEASLANKSSYIADANPLARLIARVKTTPYDTDLLRSHTTAIIKSAAKFKTAPVIEVVNAKLWYPESQKKILEKILRAINQLGSSEEIDFFKVCFSVLVRKMSYADPSVSVPVRLKDKPSFTSKINEKIKNKLQWINTADPISEFYKICEMNIYKVQITNKLHPQRQASQEVGHDARKLLTTDYKEQMVAGSIPLTITSPPYGSAQKYIRSTCLSLNWLGMASVQELRALESKSIGREHITIAQQLEKTAPLDSNFESLLNKVSVKNTTRALITRTYLNELGSAIKEISRVTEIGGHVVMIVGNNVVSGESLRNDEYLISEFEKHALKLELSLVDNIKSRGLMTKRNKTASMISREHILVFTKSKP